MTLKNLFDLQGKTALITGGAGGIGFAAAEAMASFGADIVLVDILDKELNEAVHKIRLLGKRVLGVLCDVSNSSEVESLVRRVIKFGGADIFVNSAAVTIRKPLLEMENKEWHKIQQWLNKRMILPWSKL